MITDVKEFLKKNGQCYIVVRGFIRESNLAKYGDDLMRIGLVYNILQNGGPAIIKDGDTSLLLNESGLYKRFGTTDLDIIEKTNWIIPYSLKTLRLCQTKVQAKRMTKRFLNKKRSEQDKWEKDTRERLLKESTKSERYLYSNMPQELKRSAQKQYKIHVGKKIYFLDFYLPKYKIAIEVDGGYHSTQEQIDKDDARDSDLRDIGIITMRITNEDVWSLDKRLEFWNRVVRCATHRKLDK